MAEIVVRWLDAKGTLHSGDFPDTGRKGTISFYWVDVLAPSEASMRELQVRFDLHPLAIEDSIHHQSRPKLDSDGHGFFMVWHTPERLQDADFVVRELDVFMGDGYLITIHELPVDAIDVVAADAARVMSRGQDWLLHGIIDHLVDSTLPIVDELGDRLEDIEDTMLGHPRSSDLATLYGVRRQLVALRRIVGPERDVLRSLARERDVMSEEAYRYFQDIGDHLQRVEDSIEAYREVAAAVMDIYLSAQSNRMNEIMKVLTVVATIFMPLTLISGIYGMNVLRGMWPPVDAAWSFGAVVASMVFIGATMSIYFRRKKWW
ncbi:MAG: magnesium/cobalt transporter CorA [Coriobacteriia bacterium]|nr:magnesium/cobalt transporter CorA [Coriobacteriia bacterium]